MKFIRPVSKSSIVNKMADAIMLELNKEQEHYTSIGVTYFQEFFVINGSTQSKEVLDFEVFKENFYKSNEYLLNTFGIKKINIIDLIRYQTNDSKTGHSFEYYQSERPAFHEKVISKVYNSVFDFEKMYYTDKLVVSVLSRIDIPRELFFERIKEPITSEFPYGYSLNNGRLLFYYGEYISNQLFSTLKTCKINLLLNEIVDEETNDLDIEVYSSSPYLYESIKSMVLDVFDFNLTKFKTNYMKGYDLSNEIDSQLDTKPWLVKDKISELYII